MSDDSEARRLAVYAMTPYSKALAIAGQEMKCKVCGEDFTRSAVSIDPEKYGDVCFSCYYNELATNPLFRLCEEVSVTDGADTNINR